MDSQIHLTKGTFSHDFSNFVKVGWSNWWVLRLLKCQSDYTLKFHIFSSPWTHIRIAYYWVLSVVVPFLRYLKVFCSSSSIHWLPPTWSCFFLLSLHAASPLAVFALATRLCRAIDFEHDLIGILGITPWCPPAEPVLFWRRHTLVLNYYLPIVVIRYCFRLRGLAFVHLRVLELARGCRRSG